MTTKTEIKKTVKKFILEKVYKDKSKIKSNTPLFKQGYFDSMGFMMLVSDLEEEYNIKIIDEDLVEENFDTINIITNFVESKIKNK
jgi:acyl carrier protein